MDPLPEDLFSDPAWHALHSKHRHLAILGHRACRYPRDVAPFAAVAAADAASMAELRGLLEPGEQVWLSGDGYAAAAGMVLDDQLTCLQLALPRTVDLTAPSAGIASLAGENAREMVALTDVAFPGFFRPRTCDMGAYFGIRVDGILVSMGGERLMLDGYPEISGICTHPSHRGRGFAESIIAASRSHAPSRRTRVMDARRREQRTGARAVSPDGLRCDAARHPQPVLPDALTGWLLDYGGRVAQLLDAGLPAKRSLIHAS